jgi:hypothetical protein
VNGEPNIPLFFDAEETERLAEATITGPHPSFVRTQTFGRGGVAQEASPPSKINASSARQHFASAVGHIASAMREEDAREELARGLATRLGIDFDKKTQWLIGGHELHVSFWRGADGLFVVRIFDGWPGRDALVLAQAFAVAITGELDAPRGPVLARWKLRMLVELGFLAAAYVALAPLPEGAPSEAVVTWEAVAALLSIRRITESPDEAFTFSAPFIARAYRLDENVVRRGKRWLERSHYLFKVGKKGIPGRLRPADLWLAREAAP